MSEDKFVLKNKIDRNHYEDYPKYIKVEDIKKFLKLLKEIIIKSGAIIPKTLDEIDSLSGFGGEE